MSGVEVFKALFPRGTTFAGLLRSPYMLNPSYTSYAVWVFNKATRRRVFTPSGYTKLTKWWAYRYETVPSVLIKRNGLGWVLINATKIEATISAFGLAPKAKTRRK
jgi:hypothetical protein